MKISCCPCFSVTYELDACHPFDEFGSILITKGTIIPMTKTNTSIQGAAILGSLALAASAFAGTTVSTGKGTVPPAPAPAAGLFDSVGATVDIGYDTHYFFRGFLISEQNVWGQVALSVPLSEKLSLGLGAWYTSSADISYDELDLNAGLSLDAGFAKIGLGYTRYEFFDGSAGEGNGVDSADEIGLTVGKALGPVNIGAGYYYDFEAEGSYIELGIDAPIAVTDTFSIVPAALVSYGDEYYSTDSDFQHVKLSVSFPIKLTATATLTPYVAGNIALGTTEEFTDDTLYGGVKLSVSF
ncbi:MAG: hypothetical protein JWL81_591 [Verrucomicrobiales bacterium]|nr:hypothetical protein [Verrucomicrobiales bacterium]